MSIDFSNILLLGDKFWIYSATNEDRKMHFIIHCLDKPGSADKRRAHFEAHKAYIAASPVKVVISGPLLAEDNETPIGSCFLVEADNLAQVKALNRDDPFYKADLWDCISILPFQKRVDNRS